MLIKTVITKLTFLSSGVINSFLSWGLFTSLARISYMAYLIHYEVLMIFYYSADYVMELSHLVLVRPGFKKCTTTIG